MVRVNDLRFNMMLDEFNVEIYATIKQEAPVIQTINIIGDCVITFNDLTDTHQKQVLDVAVQELQKLKLRK